MVNTKVIKALDAVTATTTSKKIYVGDAKRIAIQLRRANHSSGSSAFDIKASCEDFNTESPTMSALNLFIDNVTNSNAQNLTRVAGKTLSSNTDAFLFLDPAVKVNFLEITVTETTDGTHSAWILIEH